MKCLVINDTPEDSLIIKHKLEGLFEFDSASNGEDGLRKMSLIEYDCIILDLVMPKKDGYQVLEEMTDKNKKKTLVMSSLSDSGAMIGSIQRGGINYLELSSKKGEFLDKLVKMGVLEKDAL